MNFIIQEAYIEPFEVILEPGPPHHRLRITGCRETICLVKNIFHQFPGDLHRTLKVSNCRCLGPLFFERKVIQYIESRPEVYEKSRQDIHKVYINLKYHLLFYDNDIHNTIITTSRQPEIPFPG